MIQFPRVVASGQLTSGATHGLARIPPAWWKANWHASFPALAGRPAIGSADGVAPDTPNDRVMECFGSYDYPDPLIATDKQVNGAKGSIMRLRRPAAPSRIQTLARTAVHEDSQGAVDELLSAIRVVSHWGVHFP